ncbi:Cyclin-dependent kinase 8 [Colletotrichum gloeosporioides]|uniref:Cyclin-dependent kinase 8 n=1 Tax=Colletotrichum gloeosporioides TaxID=474922 RepID=A0A8H4FKS1_COLGL|nr:Cyclin-dependent kinase 8 [Colletotrichum gloeosporioides]KAF3805938.1 Cyclin-dependent kinase 8 [Colletotrichum gloeosporioides]
MDIEDEIRGRIKKTEDSKTFLPNDAIDELTAQDHVRNYLQANYEYLSNEANIDSLVRYVTDKRNPAKRVFLILVYCGHVQHLFSLQQDGFHDADLPIETTWKKPIKRYSVYTKMSPQSQESGQKLWDCFSTWKDKRDVEAFDEKQWCFMAPVFEANVFDYHLSPNCPIPIMDKTTSTQKVGYSGVVIRVTIHQAHIQAEYRGQQIASKQMHPDMKLYYEQESKALRIIHDLKHPHLIQPLAAYTRGGQCGFFFPWANGGTLEDYWKSSPRPEGDSEIQWVLNQLCGLCGATEALHQKNCRHTDLKPANILRFIEGELPGRLRIADVGLAKIHQNETTKREELNIITSAKTSTKRYEAPELQQKLEQISRVFDVWSLGCVFLEFLVWTCYGSRKLIEFLNSNAPFWEVSAGKYQRSTRVNRQIEDIRAQLALYGGATALKRCLDFVAKRMLVPAYKDRADASEACHDEFQTTLLKEWVRVCDKHHDHPFEPEPKLPTRVLDVGTKGQPNLRLRCSEGSTSGKYIALSHCWGNTQCFKTLKSNITNLETCIEFEELPKTFKDAIEVTRVLGFRYLWIDSLCIVQDDPLDWKLEAVSMEHVFSSASITIAASSAKSSSEGFLNSRGKQLPFLTIQTPSGRTVFIRKSIDNFRRDVEGSVLNQRGWVLQERALARRTIHFTSTQVYWECGRGIHCETMMKLVNPKAAFLGDSDFPNSALAYFKGARIRLFQNLYQIYSTLGFSHMSDRPMAIRGLEERLLKTFNTKGGFGVFERYLHRSLLWQRQEGSTLIPITGVMNTHIPSWSWMSHSGPISFLNAPFDRVDWNENIHSPFNSKSGRKQHWKAGQDDVIAHVLRCRLRNLRENVQDLEQKITFDRKLRTSKEALTCIVLGTEKPTGSKEDIQHYVLVLKPVAPGVSGQYMRAGIGRLLSNDMSNEEGVEVDVF